jgi:hypothetical protein
MHVRHNGPQGRVPAGKAAQVPGEGGAEEQEDGRLEAEAEMESVEGAVGAVEAKGDR